MPRAGARGDSHEGRIVGQQLAVFQAIHAQLVDTEIRRDGKPVVR